MNPCRMNRGLLFTLFLFLSTILPSSAVAFTERGFEVVNGEHRLPGTLCLPDGDVRAVVVFVHGSGPQDRDETLGPNRFFLSLAHAFAAEGIASLRYDKRTFVEKRAVEGFTYREESVDDAICAARLLHEAGYRHIYIVGHSLGGHLAPLIVNGAKEWVEGAVILSGNAFTLTECIRTQVRYLGRQQGLNETLIQSGIDRLLASMPESYLAFDRDYNATKTAARVANDNPHTRWMVVQGGHDYQVTFADYSQWTMALGKRATYFFGPTLDHLLRSLPAMATPEDYLREGETSPEALAAITAFILSDTTE